MIKVLSSLIKISSNIRIIIYYGLNSISKSIILKKCINPQGSKFLQDLQFPLLLKIQLQTLSENFEINSPNFCTNLAGNFLYYFSLQKSEYKSYFQVLFLLIFEIVFQLFHLEYHYFHRQDFCYLFIFFYWVKLVKNKYHSLLINCNFQQSSLLTKYECFARHLKIFRMNMCCSS